MLGFSSIAELAIAEIPAAAAAVAVAPGKVDKTIPPAVGAEWQYYDHLEYPYLSHPLIRIKRYGG